MAQTVALNGRWNLLSGPRRDIRLGARVGGQLTDSPGAGGLAQAVEWEDAVVVVAGAPDVVAGVADAPFAPTLSTGITDRVGAKPDHDQPGVRARF